MELTKLAQSAVGSPAAIRKLWRSGADNKPPDWHPGIYQDASDRLCLDDPFSILARAALEFGESFLALDIAEGGIRALKMHPAGGAQVVLRGLGQLGHCKALALLRTGSTSAAQELLQALYERDRDDLEVAAALARTYKDLAFLAEPAAAKVGNLERAHNLYLAAFKATGDLFAGINASATALWLDRRDLAEALANQVATHCLSRLELQPGDYWLLATLAECRLIMRDADSAICFYEKARSHIELSHKWANLEATRKQARRICEYLGSDFSIFDRVFRFPKVIVFSGHMFDRPDRPVPRFPESMESEVRAELRKRLARLNAGFGVSSAACGSDFIFIEEMLDLGADVRVVLPWPKADFLRSSVDIKPGAGWIDRFNSILERVTSVTYLSQQTEPKATLWGHRYLNECISGLAIIRAKTLSTELIPVAVWDLREGEGPGGTGNFVSFWKEKLRDVEIIPLSSGKRNQDSESYGLETTARAIEDRRLTVSRGQETIKTILFADVLGYTKIPEREIEYFVTRFLARVSALVDTAPQRPIVANTWGDAIYLVFDDVIAAGQFAVLLRDVVQKTDWALDGISAKLSLRISLHTGPVLLCVDPIVRHMTITGAHVSHAARIEPKVSPGEIWTSESFAAQIAIASLDRTPPFGLDYLGQIELAKGYGAYALFRLRPHLKPPE